MWTLIVLLALSGLQDDAVRLVEQLGSPRFNEREEATETLKRLGSTALGALRTGAKSDDIELRTRAIKLVTEIESRMMVEPTLVKLNYKDRSVVDVVKDLSEQANVSIALFPENAPAWAEKQVTLETAEPVPFWDAIDRLSRSVGLMVTGVNPVFQMQGNVPQLKRRAISLQMMMSNGSAPSSFSGPVRSVVSHVLHHRDRHFNQNMVPGQGAQEAVAKAARADDRPLGAQAGVTTETFGVGIQMTPEPRLTMIQNGNVKVIEASDETGRSLLAPAEPGANRFYNSGMAGNSMLQLQVSLSPPSPGAKLIKQLKLSVPLILMSRRGEPMAIRLDQAKGKTFENNDMAIQIHDVKLDPNQQFTVIELTAKLKKTESAGNANLAPFGQEFATFRFNPSQSQSQVEIVDAQGRQFTNWYPATTQPGNDGVKMEIRVPPNEGIGAPAEFRIYDLGRAELESVVELHDIPLP